MFQTKELLNLGNSYIFAHRSCYLSPDKYVACCLDRDKGCITPGKLSEIIKSGNGDATMEGTAGGYGGSGVSRTENNSPSTAEEGGNDRSGTQAANKETKDGRRREDVDMEDARKDAAGSTATMAKAGAVGAVESVLKFWEMAKETMDRMWDAAKETTENVRDAVADDGGNDDDDHRREATDKHVEDLRRTARGYDLEDG